jgi:hypothetical protein
MHIEARAGEKTIDRVDLVDVCADHHEIDEHRDNQEARGPAGAPFERDEWQAH